VVGVVDLLEQFLAVADENTRVVLPVLVGGAELLTAIAFHDPAPVLGHDVKVLAQRQQDLLGKLGPRFEDLSVQVEAVRVLRARQDLLELPPWQLAVDQVGEGAVVERWHQRLLVTLRS
jgi:hypothetical protein